MSAEPPPPFPEVLAGLHPCMARFKIHQIFFIW